MKNKLLLIGLCTVLCLGALTACEGGDKPAEDTKPNSNETAGQGTVGEADKTNPSDEINSDKCPLEHSFTNYISNYDATCTENGTKTAKCDNCEKTDTVMDNENLALGHLFTNYMPNGDSNYGVDGTKTAICNRVNCDVRDTIPDVGSAYSEGLTFELNDDKQSYTLTGKGTCTDTDLIIPAAYDNLPVTSIKKWALANCADLTSVTVPNSVTSIGKAAFYGCSSLTSITIPFVGAEKDEPSDDYFGYIFGANRYDYENYWRGSIPTCLKTVVITDGTSISDGAFRLCDNITSITISNSITVIGDGAFSGCFDLTSIAIPDSVTTIGDDAFRSCSSLTDITIPDSVTRIGSSAFSDCTSLIENENNVHYVDTWAINCDTSATSVILRAGIKGISDDTFKNCALLRSITIPNSVTNIGDGAFSDCSSLTSITIPNSVTSIGYKTFADCTSLTSITIPNGITSIDGNAFHNCSDLISITVPNSVTNIGYDAFIYCDSLTCITFNGTTDEWTAIEKNVGWKTDTGHFTVYCTDGTVAKDGTVTLN